MQSIENHSENKMSCCFTCELLLFYGKYALFSKHKYVIYTGCAA